MGPTGMDTRERIPQGDAGFTLVELLIATMMTLIVFSAALALLDISGRTEPEIASRNAKIQAAQLQVERVIREIRQTSAVVAASPTSLTIETYVPRTSCTGSTLGDARSCRVTYSCVSGSCTRTISAPGTSTPASSTTFLSGLTSNDVFTCSPSCTSPTAVNFTVVVASESGSGEDAITLSDGAAFRNVTGAVGS